MSSSTHLGEASCCPGVKAHNLPGLHPYSACTSNTFPLSCSAPIPASCRSLLPTWAIAANLPGLCLNAAIYELASPTSTSSSKLDSIRSSPNCIPIILSQHPVFSLNITCHNL